eukprot:6189559-Pleurochrysis_carterae.AAC.2
MASLVGLRFGRHKWRGTDKTVEGSAAAALSMLIAATPLLLPPMLPPMLPLLPYPLSYSLSHPLSHTLSNAQSAAAEEGEAIRLVAALLSSSLVDSCPAFFACLLLAPTLSASRCLLRFHFFALLVSLPPSFSLPLVLPSVPPPPLPSSPPSLPPPPPSFSLVVPPSPCHSSPPSSQHLT